MHTPTPWKLGEENVGGGFNIYAGPMRIAHTSIQARVISPSTRLLDEPEAKANAALIVKAVNGHEALLDFARNVAGLDDRLLLDAGVIKVWRDEARAALSRNDDFSAPEPRD